MILRFRPTEPLPHWRAANDERPYSPFSAAYSQTLKVLDRELWHLGAVDGNGETQAILQLVARGGQITRTGQLRSDADVDHPGVILTVDSTEHGTLVYETDAFAGRTVYRSGSSTRVKGWHANLRAIALGLEALRQVERYGIARRGQQYAGFGALPPAREMGAASLTVDAAVRLLCDEADWAVRDRDDFDNDDINTMWREAAKRCHPDMGGDPETFRRITQARDLLLADGR